MIFYKVYNNTFKYNSGEILKNKSEFSDLEKVLKGFAFAPPILKININIFLIKKIPILVLKMGVSTSKNPLESKKYLNLDIN